jgi:NAD(P)-dependent dehydrogenase (short-subunit alcohol dehydrogenase family)
MDRWGQASDVAQVAVFLCSEGASFVSGQIVPVNGGFRFATGSAVNKED